MTAIDPLANAKGVVRVCELCQKPAYIQCSDCRVTFYWSVTDTPNEQINYKLYQLKPTKPFQLPCQNCHPKHDTRSTFVMEV